MIFSLKEKIMLDSNVDLDFAELWDASLQSEKSCFKLQPLSPALFYIFLPNAASWVGKMVELLSSR